MKWAEGVCGAVAGIGGVVALALILWLGPIYAPWEVCVGRIHPGCHPAPSMMPVPAPQAPFDVVIPLGVVFVLFIGVAVGTWLDLRGNRVAGRLILLISTVGLLLASVSFLPMALSFVVPGALPAARVVLAPVPALALITCALAGIRREAPHSTATSSAQP